MNPDRLTQKSQEASPDAQSLARRLRAQSRLRTAFRGGGEVQLDSVDDGLVVPIEGPEDDGAAA